MIVLDSILIFLILLTLCLDIFLIGKNSIFKVFLLIDKISKSLGYAYLSVLFPLKYKSEIAPIVVLFILFDFLISIGVFGVTLAFNSLKALDFSSLYKSFAIAIAHVVFPIPALPAKIIFGKFSFFTNSISLFIIDSCPITSINL